MPYLQFKWIAHCICHFWWYLQNEMQNLASCKNKWVCLINNHLVNFQLPVALRAPTFRLQSTFVFVPPPTLTPCPPPNDYLCFHWLTYSDPAWPLRLERSKYFFPKIKFMALLLWLWFCKPLDSSFFSLNMFFAFIH